MAFSSKTTQQEKDFRQFLPFLHGGRSYMQANQQELQNIIFPGSFYEQSKTEMKHTSSQLVEMAKLALSREELDIAEKHCSHAIRKQILECRSTEESWQPYFYLGEALERKSAKSDGNPLEKQRYLLQAGALYNFVKNCLNAGCADTDCSIEKMKVVSGRLQDIQNNLVLSAEGDSLRCHFDSELDKRELAEMRNEAKEYLQSLKQKESLRDSQETEKRNGSNKFIERANDIRKLCERISSRIKQFLSRVINQCVQVLGVPPCEYEIVVLGSLARDEMTPYSDLEWAILTSSEEEKCKVFFRYLTNLVHLQIINLGETILPSMGIKALSGEWFYDNVTPRGISFDGFLPQACKTPLGNMKDFELIHSPAEMAEFQTDSWYRENASLADILLTVAPLEPSGQVKLIEQYKAQLEKYLSSSCVSQDCHDYISNELESPPCRGVCRGMAGLRKDFLRYEDMLPSIGKTNEDGKLYDVKKEIYRLVDRVFASLAACFGIRANGAFKILNELEMNGIITSEGRENLTSAAAIALELRIKTYLEAGKQGEQVIANAIDKDEAIVNKFDSFYRLPNEEKLFHFFFVASPLYRAIGQYLVLEGQIPNSFAERAFFDCSPAVKGHVYRRILKYEQAVECYESALETNAGDTEMRLCMINTLQELDSSAEMAIHVEKQLEALIRSVCKKYNLPEGNVDENGHYVPMTSGCNGSLLNETEGRWELKRVLVCLRNFHSRQGNIELAEKISCQCRTIVPTVYQSNSELHVSLEKQSEEIVASLWKVVEEEGICIQSIECLNQLSKFLMVQEKFQQAYQCLQRALAMERTLFLSNFNQHTCSTLSMLLVITITLSMYEEGKIYYKELLQLRKSLNIASDAMLIENELIMACLCLYTNHDEEGISHLQGVLPLLKTDSFKRESYMECITRGLLGTFWTKLNEPDKALKSTMGALACSSKTGKDINVPLTCAAADNFCKMGRYEDAVFLLEKSLEEANSELEMSHKAEYLMTLGEMHFEQGLAGQAEKYFREALECLMVDKKNTGAMVDTKNTCGIVECLLKVGDIMFEKDESSEVKSLLEEAWKYASTLTNDHQLYDFIRRIGLLWVKLGDIKHALVWYGEVLEKYKKSSALINVPLFECELHMNIGDMTELYFSSADCDVSLSPEKREHTRRVHYERAARVLHDQIALGNANPITAHLFVLLASKYKSLDLIEEEKLLYKASEVCDALEKVDGIWEIKAAALTGLSDTKWLSGDHVSSFDFLQRSLTMEMELNSTNYTHVPDLLYRLARFHSNKIDKKLLRDITERVLEFIDIVETLAFPKHNIARCLWAAYVLYLSIGEDIKAYSALQRAIRLFDAAKVESTTNDQLHVRACHERLFAMYPYAIDIQEWNSSVLSPIAYPGATESLVDAISTEISAEVERETSSNKAEQIPSNVNTASILQNITTQLFDFSTSCYTESVLETSFYQPWKRNEKTASKDTDTNVNKQSEKVQSFEERINRLNLLAENVNRDLEIGNILQAFRTIRGTLKPFIMYLFKENCPGNIDPADYLFDEALKAKESHRTLMVLVYLHLADLFSSQPQLKAKISHLRGECNLSERNYRTAALCFADVAGFFAEAKNVDPCAPTKHLVVLTELARSHMLCNEYEAALKTCREGMRLFGASESRESEFLHLRGKLFLLAAQCLTNLATADHQLQEVVTICTRGLSCSKLIDGCTQPDELWGFVKPDIVWQFVKLNFKLQRCLATALFRLDKVEESQETVEGSVDLLKLIYLALEGDVDDADRDTDKLKISCCLYSWIGQAELMSGDSNVALTWLTKSLSAFLAVGIPDTVSMEQEFLELLDAITAAKENLTKSNVTAFDEMMELCIHTLLKEPDGLNMLPRLFKAVGQLYVDRGREDEATMLYERALTALECAGSLDVKKARDEINTLLVHCHRRQWIKSTGKSAVEERSLADKFYQLGMKSKENFVLKISYARFLYDQGLFEEVREVLEQVISKNDELWDIQITCSYSSRILYSPAVKSYIEDHGECVTTAGILAYNLLVHVCVALGRKKEAVTACRRLSEKGEDVELFANRPPLMQYILSFCHKALASLAEKQGFLDLNDTKFPLSDSDLEKVYIKLDEWTPSLVRSEKRTEQEEQLSGETGGFRDCNPSTPSQGDSEEGDKNLIVDILEMIEVQQKLFDKPFVIQKAILEMWSLGNDYDVYESLGKILSARGRIDGAIECYEYCLTIDEDGSNGEYLVTTLAVLYQMKAMTVLNEDKTSYKRWMSSAEECFNKLRQKTKKIDSFAARACGSFFFRQGRFDEAITQFQNSLDEKCGTEIALNSIANSLLSAYLQREIEARGKLSLPLEILVYHEMVPAFLKLNKVDDAQQTLQQMERQVKLFRAAPEYALILSVLGYTHKDVGNLKKAKDIFLSVLQINPGHSPVIDALETCH